MYHYCTIFFSDINWSRLTAFCQISVWEIVPCLFINLLQNIKNAQQATKSNDWSHLILDDEVDFIPLTSSSHLLLFNFLNELRCGKCLEHFCKVFPPFSASSDLSYRPRHVLDVPRTAFWETTGWILPSYIPFCFNISDFSPDDGLLMLKREKNPQHVFF